jgi:hypothetical protein
VPPGSVAEQAVVIVEAGGVMVPVPVLDASHFGSDVHLTTDGAVVLSEAVAATLGERLHAGKPVAP